MRNFYRHAFIGVRFLLQRGIYLSKDALQSDIYWSEVFITDMHLLERYLLQIGIYWCKVFITERHLLERGI